MKAGAKIVSDFVKALRAREGFTVAQSPISQNVFEVRGGVNSLLYIHGRSEEPYRWGVTANVVERLQTQNQRWVVVLLFESENSGYVLSSSDVLNYIKNTWPLGSDGDYKPAPGKYLENNESFSSVAEFIEQLKAS